MWLFTQHGFFSAVCAREGDGGFGRPVDLDRVMVRARRHEHLESLQNRFIDELHDVEILETPRADYAYRILVSKSEWSSVLVRLIEEMDYDNFKSKVAQHQGPKGIDYEQSLHDVWTVMHRLQR